MENYEVIDERRYEFEMKRYLISKNGKESAERTIELLDRVQNDLPDPLYMKLRASPIYRAAKDYLERIKGDAK
jgi:hypothetical protein